MSNKFVDEWLAPIGKATRREWKGFLAGIVLASALGYLFFASDIQNYRDFGTRVGTYKIPIGESVAIAKNALRIQFSSDVFSARNPKDTVWLFPRFYIYPNYYPRFRVGRRLGIDCPHFYYTVELTELKYDDNDTVATFVAHKREYPKTARDKE